RTNLNLFMNQPQKSYSDIKATIAIAKASFRSITRSPSAVVFNLAFPLIFILVFGFIGGNSIRIDVGIKSGSDLNNPIIQELKQAEAIHLITELPDDEMSSD